MTTQQHIDHPPVALVTGGSEGLGRELVMALATEGWHVVTDARRPDALADLTHPRVTTVAGDVTDADHRRELVDLLTQRGRLDLLVHNASTLGPTPMRRLDTMTIDDLQQVWRTNIGAPLVLTAALLPLLVASRGVLLGISSDAGVEHYPTWGLYGASKAALDHVVGTYGAENPDISAYAVDPGDMRTAMYQAAFPGEDINDRALPGTVVPHLLGLVEQRPPSGRYRAVDLPVGEPALEEVR